MVHLTLVEPDPRPIGRIRDPKLLRDLHFEWRECVLCLWTHGLGFPLSLHHVCKHPRDDVRENLVMLCGDGVRGCHGRIEANDREALQKLGRYLRRERPDVLLHLEWRMGRSGAREWFDQRFG